MKLSIVFVLLLFGYNEGASNEHFDHKNYCNSTGICIKDNVTVEFISNKQHLSVECKNAEKLGIEFLPYYLTNITALSIKQCIFQESSFKLLKNNKLIKTLFIESNGDAQFNLSSFNQIKELEKLVIDISGSSKEQLKFNLSLISPVKIKFINLTNIGARRDLVIEGSSSDYSKKFINLNISGFNLKMLNRNSFKWLFETEKLVLNNNRMEFLEGIFQQAYANKQLKDVIIENNKIPNGVLPDALLSHLSLLENVSLDYNKLESIPNELFFKSKKIKRLSMKHNVIKVLSFGLPTKCIELDLSYNQIYMITSKALQLGQLKVLNLEGNKIADKLCDEIISDIPSMTKLKHLNLRSNSLKEFSLWKWNFVANTIVDLRKNNIIRFNMEIETDPQDNFTFLMDMIRYNFTCKNIKIHKYIKEHVNFTDAEIQPSPKLKNMLQERILTNVMCEDEHCPDDCECTMVDSVYLIGCFNSSLVTFPSVPPLFCNDTTEIDVSCNNIVELPRNLRILKNIIRLNVSNNKVIHIYDDNIPMNTKFLDVRKNPLQKRVIIYMKKVNNTNVTAMNFRIVDEFETLDNVNIITYICIAVFFLILMLSITYVSYKNCLNK